MRELQQLPGEVVRPSEPVTRICRMSCRSAGLEARILQTPSAMCCPSECEHRLFSFVIEWLPVRWIRIVSPQLATVATMLLVAVRSAENTVSTDGSVRGLYRASLQLAERTADSATGYLKKE